MEIEATPTTGWPYADHWLDLPQGRIHYIDEGVGPTLLFVHFGPAWSFVWKDVIEELRPWWPEPRGCVRSAPSRPLPIARSRSVNGRLRSGHVLQQDAAGGVLRTSLAVHATSSSEWLQPDRERVHEVHARAIRVAPSSEIDPALIDVAEVQVQRSSRLERLVGPRVEDHAWHLRVARLVFERGHQGACYAAPTVRLLDVEIAHHREAPGLGEHFGRAVFVHADADEPGRCIIQPPDEEDEPAATLQLQLAQVPFGRARRDPRDDGGQVPFLDASDLDRAHGADASGGARRSRRAFPPYSCTTVAPRPLDPPTKRPGRLASDPGGQRPTIDHGGL